MDYFLSCHFGVFHENVIFQAEIINMIRIDEGVFHLPINLFRNTIISAKLFCQMLTNVAVSFLSL